MLPAHRKRDFIQSSKILNNQCNEHCYRIFESNMNRHMPSRCQMVVVGPAWFMV